jgi:hypothetical protein
MQEYNTYLATGSQRQNYQLVETYLFFGVDQMPDNGRVGAPHFRCNALPKAYSTVPNFDAPLCLVCHRSTLCLDWTRGMLVDVTP